MKAFIIIMLSIWIIISVIVFYEAIKDEDLSTFLLSILLFAGSILALIFECIR